MNEPSEKVKINGDLKIGSELENNMSFNFVEGDSSIVALKMTATGFEIGENLAGWFDVASHGRIFPGFDPVEKLTIKVEPNHEVVIENGVATSNKPMPGEVKLFFAALWWREKALAMEPLPELGDVDCR